ncbi:hypothetical protein SDJN02_07653, partial [Cucurbita argyrosperma subsp. argyrosperma]
MAMLGRVPKRGKSLSVISKNMGSGFYQRPDLSLSASPLRSARGATVAVILHSVKISGKVLISVGDALC